MFVTTSCAKLFHFTIISLLLLLAVRPLAVEIVNGSSPLSADRRYIVQCQSVGSRPPAKITWWMGGVQLTATNQTVSVENMYSISCIIHPTCSIIRFTPSNTKRCFIIKCTRYPHTERLFPEDPSYRFHCKKENPRNLHHR